MAGVETVVVESGVEIRPIAPADSLEALTRLLHAAYASLHAMGLNYTAVDQSVEVTRRRIANGVCYVAVDRGELAGTIVVEPPRRDPECAYFTLPHVASAHQLAVAPPHQGRGIGSSLLAQAESWALANGYSELALDTAEPARHLIALYERRGYRHVGFAQWKGKKYRSVLMTKILSRHLAAEE